LKSLMFCLWFHKERKSESEKEEYVESEGGVGYYDRQ